MAEEIITPLNSSQLKELYKKLAMPLPREAIQEADQKAFKGYDTIGFGYQWVVNRFNDVLGIAHWKVTEQDIKVTEGAMNHVTKKITIQIGNWINRERTTLITEQDENNITVPKSTQNTHTANEFEVLAQQEGYGGHAAKLFGDAHKGAYTNGLKKAAAMFGVGREAYEATLDEDNRDAKKVYEDLPVEKRMKADEWINRIQKTEKIEQLSIIGKEISKIKGEKNMLLVIRGEYNKQMIKLKNAVPTNKIQTEGVSKDVPARSTTDPKKQPAPIKQETSGGKTVPKEEPKK